MESILRLSFQKDPITLDPQQCGDPVSSATIFLLFKGLMRLEADHTLVCDLADSYQILDNYKRYVFHLGKHFWSDGSAITAHDFVYSWKRALSPTFPARSVNFYYHFKNAEAAKKGRLSLDKVGIHAKDDHTLIIELENSCSFFLELTSFCPFFPISSKADTNAVFSICSGTFQLHHWNKGESIHLTKNPFCFRPGKVNEIKIKIIPDEKEAFNLFEKHQLDWIGDPISPLPLNYLPSLVLNKKVKPVTGVVSCWFNTLIKPFSNLHLRKAFAYAIPREKLLQKLLLPDALLADRFCPSLIRSDCPTFTEVGQNKIRELFRQALKGINLKQLKITLSYEDTDVFSRLAALLKVYWKEEFDISVILEPLSFKDFYQRLPSKQFQVALLRILSQHSDPISFLERFESSDLPRNFSGWENRKYQAVLKQYQKTACPLKRQALGLQAEKILLEAMPIAPLYYSYYAYLQKPHVHNFSISPAGVVQFDRVVIENKQVFEEDDLFRQALDVS